jgi:DNA invertase Pin-like site-specific DNA recombinase
LNRIFDFPGRLKKRKPLSFFYRKGLKRWTLGPILDSMKKSGTLIQAYGYLRVSGRGQMDGDGFPRQREAIKKFAARNGLEIVGWYEEGITGTEEWENRPAWARMIEHLNGVRSIVVEGLDRLARELFVQEWILRDLRKRGVTLLSSSDPDIDANPSPERVFFRQIMGAVAQYDRTMVVRKLKGARQRQKAATGRCEGRKPFGDRPGESELLQRMRTLRNEGKTFDGIAKILTDEGISTRTAGRRWFGSTVAKLLRRRAA